MADRRSDTGSERREENERDTMFYSDAYYKPAPDERGDGYGYNPVRYGSGGESDRPKKRPLRGRYGLGLLLLMASAALILFLGLLSAGLFSVPAQAAYVCGPAPGESRAASAEPVSGGADELRELTAEEVYEAACPVTVGVTIPGYTHNIFGQLSANVVTGTGIVLSEDGYILTNYHVIEKAYERGAGISVLTYDGEIYEAEVVGSEAASDLVVLRIDAQGLVPARFGDSDALRVGQTIYAVGNPLGELTYTMTGGIVSALDRSITTDVNVTVDMFQIDAAINSGNSGGPVFDRYGQVIGVVTAKYSLSGMEGLGFAIPSSDACAIAEQIIQSTFS